MTTIGPTRPFTLFQAESFDLDSTNLDRRYEISVALPLGYHASLDRRYPLLIVLDANICFATAVEASRLMALGGEVEELVVVGVGSPWTEGLAAFGQRRFHEFSPSDRWELDGPYAEITRAMMRQAGVDRMPLGGAPKFLDLLRDELLPAVAQAYRLDLESPGLFGDSAGGTFALYALLSGRSPFRKYIIGSPATAQCNDELFRMEERYAASHGDLDAQIFLAAGWRRWPVRSSKALGSRAACAASPASLRSAAIPTSASRATSLRTRGTCRSCRRRSPAASDRCGAPGGGTRHWPTSRRDETHRARGAVRSLRCRRCWRPATGPTHPAGPGV